MSTRPLLRPAAALPVLAALLGALGTLAARPALADDDHGARRPTPAAYTQECGACHLAFPAAFLPAASWARVMGGLERHYGVDAALDDAKVAAQIAAYLQQEGGRSKRGREAPPEDRITRAAWFERKHHEVRPEVWRRAAVKSPANCTACHRDAERGDFDDDHVRIPR